MALLKLESLHLKVLKHERKWKDVLRLCKAGPYLWGKGFMSKVCSPQLDGLGKPWKMGRVESQQSWNEVPDLQGRIRSYNRKHLCTKGSFVNDFDIDHGISIILTLLDHKLFTSGKIHKFGGSAATIRFKC